MTDIKTDTPELHLETAENEPQVGKIPSEEGDAAGSSTPQDQPPNPGLFHEYAESALVTAVIFLFIITFVIQAYKIPTGSMEKNLLIGDHLLVNKFVFGQNANLIESLLPARPVRRGDIIVFKYPLDPTQAFVKRVIGLPGDEIEIVGHTVLANGKALQEPYTHFLYGSDNGHFGPQKVPEGSFFALGDNRDNSQDSRYWGFVPRDLIMGRAFLIYWSYETDRDEYHRNSLPERASQILDVCLNFFTKTRWERTLLVAR